MIAKAQVAIIQLSVRAPEKSAKLDDIAFSGSFQWRKGAKLEDFAVTLNIRSLAAGSIVSAANRGVA